MTYIIVINHRIPHYVRTKLIFRKGRFPFQIRLFYSGDTQRSVSQERTLNKRKNQSFFFFFFFAQP